MPETVCSSCMMKKVLAPPLRPCYVHRLNSIQGGNSLADNDRLIANPSIVLREEFDDWAVLFDPDTGNAFGLNPVSVYIWKFLDGQHTVNDIGEKLRANCKGAPEDAEKYVESFLKELTANGLAGHEFE